MTIKELYEQVCEKKSIQLKLEELNKQKTQLNDKIVVLKGQYEKEQNDVDKLENSTLSSMFYSLTGKLDEKLDKETRELLAAKGIYDNAVFQLNNVCADIAGYENRLSQLADCETQYEQAVKSKLDELKGTNPEIVNLQIELANSSKTTAGKILTMPLPKKRARPETFIPESRTEEIPEIRNITATIIIV